MMMRKNILILINALFLMLVLFCGCQSTIASNVDANRSTITQSEKSVEDYTTTYPVYSKELKWNWLIEPDKFGDLFFVDKDLIAAKGKNGKYTVINTKGDTEIPFEYDSISEFSEGIALVSNGGNLSYINKNGFPISKDVFQGGYCFSESFAAVKNNDLWGYIDISGNVVIEYQFIEVESFSEDRAAVKVNDKWGFISKSGDLLIKNQFDQVRNFKEGMSAVKLNGKWGFVDCSGNIIANLQYDEVENFYEGYAAVMKNNKWGFIDKSGSECIDLKYDDVGNFSEGKAAVKLADFKEGIDAWAYVDKNDNVVIDFYPYEASEGRMVWVGEFKDGLAFVSKSLYCIIDDKGNNVFFGDSKFFISSLKYNLEFDAIPGYVYTDQKMTVKKYGLVGLNGEQRLEPIFDYVNEIHDNFVIVEKIIDSEYRKGIIRLFNE